jgi:ribosomal protein S18 acetylase RimI-like enzyme
MKRKGLTLFGLSQGEVQVGFIALERLGAAIYSVEKLAVLPTFRHHGYGQMLLKFAIDHVRNNGGQKVSIGIINEHFILKNWYLGLGFKETGTKKFPHLPFTVCFMERGVYKTHDSV